MQLKYRGIVYRAATRGASASSTVVASTDAATAPEASLRQPGEVLMYRGVRYTR